MDSMIAYCGLICDSCLIHLAALEPDKFRQQNMRESIAEKCNQLYGMNLKSEDITDCDGCKTISGKLFSGCLDCEIRKCASKKNIESCAYCSNYSCGILKEHFLIDSTAQSRLEEIRRSHKS